MPKKINSKTSLGNYFTTVYPICALEVICDYCVCSFLEKLVVILLSTFPTPRSMASY